MKILVLLEVGVDVRVAPELDPRSGRVREAWLVRQLDPAAERALELALAIKNQGSEAEINVLHLGAADAETWLRQALARGADRALRIWSEELGGAGTEAKALVLATAAQTLGYDLILSGVSGVVHAGGQLGILLAEHLSVPCITQAEDIVLRDDEWFEAARALENGYVERVAAPLPAVVTVSAGPGGADTPLPPTAQARLRAAAAEIPVLDLGDLGLPRAQLQAVGRALQAGPPAPRRPRVHPIAAPDPALPAFDRILKLVEGSVKRRAGRVVREGPQETVEEIFTALQAEGWLDHLHPRSADSSRKGDA